jgi:hypothetical protein
MHEVLQVCKFGWWIPKIELAEKSQVQIDDFKPNLRLFGAEKSQVQFSDSATRLCRLAKSRRNALHSVIVKTRNVPAGNQFDASRGDDDAFWR